MPDAACQIHRLPEPDGALSSAVMAGDPSGRWLVGWVRTASGSSVVRWRSGKLFDAIEAVPDGGSVTGVNRHGDVSGDYWNGDVYQAFAVVDGDLVELNTDGEFAYTSGISAAGKVSGTIGDYLYGVAWDVADPYRQGRSAARRCADEIDAALASILPALDGIPAPSGLGRPPGRW